MLVCFAGWPAAARAASGAAWSQFQGGPAHPGAGDGPAPPYVQAWRFRAAEGPLSGAVVDGDVAITVGERAVYGVDLASGEQAWQLIRNGGPVSVPALGAADGLRVLAFVDTSESGGTSLVRVDLGKMQELAPRTPLLDTSRSGIAIEGAEAFVGDDKGNVYAVDLATGTLDWTAKGTGEVLATPAVDDGKVFAVIRDPEAQSAKLVALDADSGREVWSFAPPTGTTMSGVAVAGGIVVVGTADRILHGLSTDDGSQRWQALALSLFSPVTAAAFPGSDLVVSDVPAGVYRIDPASGGKRWDHQLNGQDVRSSPVITGGSVLLGLNDGRLVALDLESGDLVWQGAKSPGLIGAIAISPDLVIAVKGGRPGSLVAWRHASGALVAIPSPTVVDPPRLFGNAALALATVFVVLFLPLRLLAARLGPPPLTTGEEEAADEDEMEDEGDTE
jgi:outer membrane protein assembly factor BamB